MTAAEIEAIAQRTAEILLERGYRAPEPDRLVDAQTLARLLGVTRACVYSKAAQLGGVRIASEGGRGRWRFDPATARSALGQQKPPEPAAVPARRRRQFRAAPGVELLPIEPLPRRRP